MKDERVTEGMLWLLSLAEQYEDVAREIRRLHANLTVMTPPASAVSTGSLGIVRISEAIRELLAHRGPMSALSIRDDLDWSRIKTRSRDQIGLVTSTLASMKMNGSVVSKGHGLWDLERGPLRPHRP